MELSKRMHARNEQQNGAAMLGIALLFMYFVSELLLVILALLLYKLDLSESIIRMGIIFTYTLSGLAGGFFIGKKMKDKRFLWGLFAGSSYFVLLFLLSLLLKQGMGMELFSEPVKILTALILCSVAGMAGGMIS